MKKLLILLPIALMACTTPQTPAQSVFLVEADYAAALRIELAYSNIPRCGKPTSPTICSEVAVIKKVQTADNVAWTAIQQAQDAVRTPEFGSDKVDTAVAISKSLTSSFVGITNTLKTK